MNVKQLIEHLQHLPAEAMVVTPGYEGGYDEVTGSKPITLSLNVNTEWYYGKHEHDMNGACKAVCIR